MFKTVYVTGAPASGKSSTTLRLRDSLPNIEVWEYGGRLTSFLQARNSTLANQDELRTRSATIATPEHIDAVDDLLLDWIRKGRSSCHLLIDSHPVTKEEYGFRITAFSLDRFKALGPDEIWFFYTEPEVTIERIAKNAAGRPSISKEEARMHTFAQGAVAATYGIAAGCPVYMFDTDTSQEELVERLRRRLD